MFEAFLVIGGIVIGILVAGIVFMGVNQAQKNNNEAPAEEPAPAQAEEPKEEPKEEPVAEPEPEPQPEPEPEEEPEEEEPEEAEEPEETEAPVVVVADENAEGEEGYDRRGKIMYAKEMTSGMRLMIGCLNPIYDERQYRVTFSYSFKARLALADEEARSFYTDFVEELAHYKKIKLRESRRQMRIGIGRDRIGIIFFKGQKLCIAYALSPEEVDYEALKIKDISGKARFEQTPAMLRLTSGLKCRRAKMLLGQIAEKYGIERKDEALYEPEMPELDRDALYRSEDIKIYATLVARAPAEEEKKEEESK